jgi:hypothetical protein
MKYSYFPSFSPQPFSPSHQLDSLDAARPFS